MSYEPTEWQSGDVVTSAKLNKLEQGVAAASGGGALVVNVDQGTGALDKTWQEIHDAMPSVYVLANNEYGPVISASQSGDYWFAAAWLFGVNRGIQFVASSANGYPTTSVDDGGGDAPAT